jgi:hypothetical protein
VHHSLSTAELELVCNAEILLAKNRVIEKVYQMFGALCEDYKMQTNAFSFPFEVVNNPKISRGENYNGLPYVMLDYPRQFSKTDVFAIRTFFWWGHFFSLTLQLQGVYQTRFAGAVQNAINQGLLDEWFITLSDEKWQHHFDNNYYEPVKKEKNYNLTELAFIKVVTKIPLNKWDDAYEYLLNNFTQIMKVLFNQAPMR